VLFLVIETNDFRNLAPNSRRSSQPGRPFSECTDRAGGCRSRSRSQLLWSEWRKGSRLIGIPFVKFLAPIQPGELFTIAFDVPENAQIDFCCRVDGRVVVEGRLEISCGACI
jgi:hypothetical protein